MKLRLPRKRDLPLLWDGLMVYLALLNVGLILFDWTYLWLRPVYFRHLPALTRLYDPVLGIEPHRLTERYLAQAREVEELLAAHPGEERKQELEASLAELRRLSVRLFTEDPFERSGQTHNLIVLEQRTRRWLAENRPGLLPPSGLDRSTGADVLEAPWRPEPRWLATWLSFFDAEIAPLLEVNYFRHYDLDGKLVDHFWLLDLPFLILFATELAVRWWRAIRRRRYARWFFFPLVYWYDFLGIVPLPQFRFFRLFRILSIYVRLYRSERTGIGRDPVSRFGFWISDILTEEVSDRVAVRILDMAKTEIREGAFSDIVKQTLLPRREKVQQQIAGKIAEIVSDPQLQERGRALLDLNLERSLEQAALLRALPLPNAVLRPLVKSLGEVVYASVFETLTATLESPDGRRALEEVVDSVIGSLEAELGRGEIEALLDEALLDALEEMKGKVKLKRWVGE